MRVLLFVILCQVSVGDLLAQPVDTNHPTYPFARQNLELFKALVAIPNNAHIPADIEQNVQWCEEQLAGHGFEHRRLATPSVPLLLATYGEMRSDLPTILFYFHLDGQPVDASFWFQEDPYGAVLKEQREGEGWVQLPWSKLLSTSIDPDWRIFARSSSDAKGPFIMFLAALTTLQNEQGSPPYNLKVILDFEEEIGSPNLAQAVTEYQDALRADMLLIFDGPMHVTNRPTITYGARGITAMTLKVFGPTFPQHSGHYGNYVPNPALRLSRLLASMKDDQGRVTIPGYYDGIVLDEEIRRVLATVPDNEQELMVKLGIGEIDKVASTYQEALQYPSLNIRGLSAGWVGHEARTIVPASATAELDLRLVVESDGERLKRLVRDHIAAQGYHILDRKPTSRERVMYPMICQVNSERKVTKAFRTDVNSEFGVWVYETIRDAFGQEPVRLRTMGGTLPISPFITTLDVPAVIVPLANSDNNQHSPNENLRLGNYFDGARTFYALLRRSLQSTDE